MRTDTSKIIKILNEGETNPETGKVYFDEEDIEYFRQFLEPFAIVTLGSNDGEFSDIGEMIIKPNGNEYVNPPRSIGFNQFHITQAFIDKVEEYCAKKYPNAKVDYNLTVTEFWMYERDENDIDNDTKMKKPPMDI